MKKALEQAIKDCAEKAAKTDKGLEAMQFTQAALNAANVLRALEK